MSANGTASASPRQNTRLEIPCSLARRRASRAMPNVRSTPMARRHRGAMARAVNPAPAGGFDHIIEVCVGRNYRIEFVHEVAGRLWLDEPKTTKARRAVDLPTTTVAALHKHRERMLAEGHPQEFVFCDTHGGPVRKSNLVRRSFLPLLKRAGLRRIRFHDLRHTAATLLPLQGVHPKVVQERLGHSQISITLDTYSHVLPSMGREAAAKLDALLEAVTVAKL